MENFKSYVNVKSILVLSLLFWSNYSNAQIFLQGSISPTQVSVGDTFTYTLSADSGGVGVWVGVQTKLLYDPSVLEYLGLNTYIEDPNVHQFEDYLLTDHNATSPPGSGPGIIRHVVGAFNIPANVIIYTIEFKVIGNAPISLTMILRDENNLPIDGTFFSDGVEVPMVANADINQVLSVEDDLIFRNSISIYPNPSSNVVYLDINQSNERIKTITIFDVTGRTVKTVSNPVFNGNQMQIDTSSLMSALYFMTVTSESGNKARFRVIIDK